MSPRQDGLMNTNNGLLIQGPIKADTRTKNLVKRLKPGDIALIHHVDLDATAARSLADCHVAAVINAVSSVSGKYPNQGPGILLESGIPLLDGAGDLFFRYVTELKNPSVTIDHDVIRTDDGFEAKVTRITQDRLDELMELAKRNISAELDAFARNTLEYLVEEKSLLLDPVDVPEIKTPIQGRHVMLVVRGEGYKSDLMAIIPYLRDVRPVLIGVDGGADALLELGLRPDIILGDMDSVSDRALMCGAELVVHGYCKDNRDAPGMDRINQLGLSAKIFHVPGTSEDMAVILADEKGASLIVAVGTHFSLVEFLDKGRAGMASTFLVRLRTGSKLVDAKGIGRLWAERNRSIAKEITLLIISALFPVMVIIMYSPWFRTVINTLRLSLRSMRIHW